MPRNGNLSFTYSSTTGALAAQTFGGGPAIIATVAAFAASTTLAWEISLDGGSTYITLFDITGTAISATVNGATGDQYYHVSLPKDCLIRPNCTAGTMTSGKSWVLQVPSQT